MVNGNSSWRRRVLMVGGAALLLTMLVAAVLASTGDGRAMSSAEARDFTGRALSSAGIEGATVGDPRRSTFQADWGPVDVWVVPARVRDQRVALYVERRGDQAVNLDDQVAPEENVLSAEEFEALDRFRWDPVADARRRRLLAPAVAAAVLAVAAGTATVIAVSRRWVPVPGRRSPLT